MIPLRDDPGERRRSFPWVMLSIVLLNIIVFVFELGVGDTGSLDNLFLAAGVVPVEFTRGVLVGPPPPLGMPWTTLFTSMFLHGGLLHIASNMLYLFIFGDNVEDRLGHLRFLLFYLLCGVIAGITHIVVNNSSTIPSVGASGAIAGVLAAYLRLFPHARVRTLIFIGPIVLVPRIAAAFLIIFWFATQFLSGVMSLGATSEQTSGGVAVWAHIGGFLAGLILVEVMRPRSRQPALSY
ncbi:MAG TPA: rhomboid family intramembrane serine protease [Chloroflexota bacterium]|jgi:membrane associated rhomboid family serine protease|nr:rhomboid family intramembrane serine protease [Chloroflexota bacterium]